MKTIEKYVPLHIVVLALIIVFGAIYNMPRKRTETAKSEPVMQSVASEEPTQTELVVEDFFVQLPPLETVECFAVAPEPIVAQNGNTSTPDPFKETPTETPERVTTIRTLPPEHPIVENEPEDPKPETAAKPCEKVEATGKESKWIPFVYFYRQSSCGRTSSPVYIMPLTMPSAPVATTEEKPVEGETSQKVSDEPIPAPTPCVPPARPLIPVLYGPMPIVGPVVPMPPVYPQPVFTPTVVPSFFGSPKLVYPNGVVIKTKVSFPNQPMKNTRRMGTL